MYQPIILRSMSNSRARARSLVQAKAVRLDDSPPARSSCLRGRRRVARGSTWPTRASRSSCDAKYYWMPAPFDDGGIHRHTIGHLYMVAPRLAPSVFQYDKQALGFSVVQVARHLCAAIASRGCDLGSCVHSRLRSSPVAWRLPCALLGQKHGAVGGSAGVDQGAPMHLTAQSRRNSDQSHPSISMSPDSDHPAVSQAARLLVAWPYGAPMQSAVQAHSPSVSELLRG